MKQTKKVLAQERVKKNLATLQSLSEAEQASLVSVQPAWSVVMITGHVPSPRNCAFLFLQSQGQPLSVIGGYRQWEAAGRQVKRGEIGYKIFVPLAKRKGNTDNTEETASEFGISYRLATVFDVSQTAPLGGDK